MILDTSVNARLQAAVGQRLQVAVPGAESETDWMGVSRSFASALSNGAIATTARGLLAAGFQALDLLGIGLVVCNAAGQVLVANRTAEDTLNAHDGLEVDADGVLCAIQGSNPSLQDLVQKAAGVAPQETGASDAAVSIARAGGKRPLTLLVRAATGGASPRYAQAAALVLIMDAATPANTVEGELQQLYGLTPMETRLAKALMEGRYLDDCCRDLGIRRSTGRMHLRNLFVKTGVRRQSELVSLLLKSIGLGPREK